MFLVILREFFRELNMSIENPSYIKIEDMRYREAKGLYLEDIKPNLIIEHRPGRTITETDNIWQSLINMNQHPIHIDKHYAEQTEFGKLLVCGLLTFSIVNGMTVSSISQNAICHLGWDKVRFSNPVFVGDTLYAETKILSQRPSQSRPGQGIVTVFTTGMNQREEIVVSFERTILLASREFLVKDQIQAVL